MAVAAVAVAVWPAPRVVYSIETHEDVAFPTNTSQAALVAFADPSGLWLLVAPPEP